jgi:P-type conjugative transfer ATPase TrbB
MPDISSNRAETARRLLQDLRRLLGPIICERLDDPAVIEVLLNPDGRVWEDRLGVGMTCFTEMSQVSADSFIRVVASTLGQTVTADRPILECELPIRGARFEAVIWPLAPRPTFAIRLKAIRVFSLADYEAAGIMTRPQRLAIEDAVATARNIMVSGGTGSGKTTLANAILGHVTQVAPDDRLLIIQDLFELQCLSENVAWLRSSETFDFTRLVKVSMRLRPDRVIIGEVRGGEAFALLKALNTGHSGGLWTIHANTASSALGRFEDLIAEATPAMKQRQIADAVHMIVSIAKTKDPDGKEVRRVQEVVRVDGYDDGNYLLTTVES